AKDGSLKTARWVAECQYLPYPDVLANEKFDHEVLAHVQSGYYAIGTRAGYDSTGSYNSVIQEQPLTAMTPEDSLVALWEIWDKKYRKRYIFAEGVPLPLLEEDWPYDYLDGFPYVKIDYIPVPNKPYGMGIYRQCEDQQLQLNRIRSEQFRWIRV